MKNVLKHASRGLALPVSVFGAAFSLSLFLLTVSRYQVFPQMPEALAFILSFLPYLIFIGGILIGWRFNNTGLVLAGFSLAMMYMAVQAYGAPVYGKRAVSPAVCKAALFLFPANLILFSLLIKRRIFVSLASLYLFLLALQIAAVSLVFNPDGKLFEAFHGVLGSYSENIAATFRILSVNLTRSVNSVTLVPVVLACLWTLAFLFIRYIYKRDIGLAGFSMIFATAMAGIMAGNVFPAAWVFFSAAGLLVISAALEGSFVLEETDILTGLSARKNVKNQIRSLKGEYVVALVDLDHFSRFNDRFGADAGDMVLKIVADKLADTAPPARTFRYGGEEFLIVFEGIGRDQARKILEEFRAKIEAFPFFAKQVKTRKPARESAVARVGENRSVRITVSIGAAVADMKARARDILAETDKALSIAKQQGRNRVVFWGDLEKKYEKKFVTLLIF